MDLTYAALKPDYTARLAAIQFTKMEGALVQARLLLRHKDRFINLQTMSKVPALWVIPVFYREAPDFNTYLGNGDPLDAPTVDEPADRGPFPTWEAGAMDALEFDGITGKTDWSWEHSCYLWERYNGFGPRKRGHVSGYVWSGTDQYTGGKYVSDGVWSPTTFDQQLGCVVLAKAIVQLDQELGAEFVS